jgi:hypothetical protein
MKGDVIPESSVHKYTQYDVCGISVTIHRPWRGAVCRYTIRRVYTYDQTKSIGRNVCILFKRIGNYFASVQNDDVWCSDRYWRCVIGPTTTRLKLVRHYKSTQLLPYFISHPSASSPVEYVSKHRDHGGRGNPAWM